MKKFLFVIVFVLIAASALPGSAEAAILSKPQNNLGLVARWSFDEGTGTSVGDSSGNGNTAAFVGSPTWVLGKLRNALSFSGTGQYLTTSVALPTSAYTKTAWIKLADCTASNNIISVGGASTASAFWAPSGQSCKVSTGHNGSWYVVQDSSGLVPGQWYFVAATYDSSVSSGTLSLYKDGALVDSATSVSAPSSGTAEIGAYHENYLMKGIIDDARIYSRALSASEIARLYNQTATTKIGTQVTQGLSGAYYDGVNFNTYVSTHTDSTVNFNPSDSLGVSYANSSNGDTFSVRWTGYVKADYTGTYTFYTTSDDGARLYVNGATVIDSWIDQGPTEHSGTINLVAGTWYPIQLDFYENGGGAVITLSWSEASVSKAIIPAANLKPSAHEVTLNTSSVSLQGGGLASGLVGLWTFDGKDTVWTSSSAGTATDRSGQGNTGTLTNLTQAGSVVIGKMGQALLFNGSSSYVRKTTFAGTPSSTMTVCAWIQTSYSGTNQYILSINRNPSNIVNEGIFEVIASTGKLRFWDYNGSSYGFPEGSSDSSTAVTDGAWHLVCFVKNSTAGTYYLDGATNGTASAASSISYGSADWIIGTNYREANSYFNGKIDDVRIYNRALTASEVKQLYNLGK